MFGHTNLANTAVLASRWFRKLASTAYLSWREKNVVIRVLQHLLRMVPGNNVRRCRHDGMIDKKIWQTTYNNDKNLVE